VSAAAAGWHDGCIGALIPYLQLYYGGVSDEQVSFVFIGQFIGYTLASLLNVTLNNQLGLGRLLVLGAAIQGTASAIIALKPPFSAILLCYTVAGFGIALQDAQYNTYIACLPGAATKLGIVHALYGAGALLSPIAATLLMKSNVAPPLFYFTNLVWCVINLTALLAGFGFSSSRSTNSRYRYSIENDSGVAPLRTVISSRVVWATLIFVSLYTGIETSEAGCRYSGINPFLIQTVS
jgi:fucose permease